MRTIAVIAAAVAALALSSAADAQSKHKGDGIVWKSKKETATAFVRDPLARTVRTVPCYATVRKFGDALVFTEIDCGESSGVPLISSIAGEPLVALPRQATRAWVDRTGVIHLE